MNRHLYIFIIIILSGQFFGQTSRSQDKLISETNIIVRPIKDSSLIYNKKSTELYFDKETTVQIIQVIAMTTSNSQVIKDLNVVQGYIAKRKAIILSDKEKLKFNKSYDKIKHDSLALTYYYFPAIASEMLNQGYCKIVANNMAQKTYRIEVKGTTTKNIPYYLLADNSVFWIGADVIKLK